MYMRLYQYELFNVVTYTGHDWVDVFDKINTWIPPLEVIETIIIIITMECLFWPYFAVYVLLGT